MRAATMNHDSAPFDSSGPEARCSGSAGRILGDHYRSLRDTAGHARDATDDGQGDRRARDAREVSIAAAFVLRVLGERSRMARRAEGSSAEEIDRMRSALRALSAESPRLAEVLSLNEIAGLSAEEVALTLGVELGTVEHDLRSARARIADILAGRK